MDVSELLVELYGRIPALAAEAVDGLTPESLTRQPSPDTNPIGWLVWHVARVQDAEISGRLGIEQLWVDGDWAASFGLTPDPSNHGYGHTPDDVAAVRPASAAACLDYLGAAHDRTLSLLRGSSPDALDEIIDRNWDPP